MQLFAQTPCGPRVLGFLVKDIHCVRNEVPVVLMHLFAVDDNEPAVECLELLAWLGNSKVLQELHRNLTPSIL